MDAEKTRAEDHSGHRARLRRKYREVGLTGISDGELLELILTYAIPRRDVSDLARKMLDGMGSVRRVLEASPDELKARFSLTDNTVTLLKLAGDLRRKPAGFSDYRRERLISVRDACEYCHELLAGLGCEAVAVIYLDGANTVLDVEKVSEGSKDGAPLPVDIIVGRAAALGAKRVLVAHNHPSNSVFPSQDDVFATDMLSRALSLRGADLVEHIIVSRSGCAALLHHMNVELPEPDASEPSWAKEEEPHKEEETL